MKITKYIGALAFVAMLAACSNEQGGRIKMRSPPKVLTGNFRPSQLSSFLS